MTDALGSALSGLLANATRVGVSANNIANLRTSGPADAPERAYQPQDVALEADANGGVRARVQNSEPATTPVYSPNDPNANAEGVVAMPNVSLENEMVNQIEATIGYKANAAAIRTLAAMDRSLLDIKV